MIVDEGVCEREILQCPKTQGRVENGKYCNEFLFVFLFLGRDNESVKLYSTHNFPTNTLTLFQC